MVQFDLGDHQAGVVAQELIHFPQVAAVPDQMPPFVHQPTHAQRQQRARIVHRNAVVEFLAGVAQLARLQVEECFVALDAYPHRGLLLAAVHRAHVVDVPLRHGHDRVRGRAPAVAGDQELAFDFDAHQRLSNRAMDSTCAVCGNMSITPADTSTYPCSLTR